LVDFNWGLAVPILNLVSWGNGREGGASESPVLTLLICQKKVRKEEKRREQMGERLKRGTTYFVSE
jgi:hypothetical protein